MFSALRPVWMLVSVRRLAVGMEPEALRKRLTPPVWKRTILMTAGGGEASLLRACSYVRFALAMQTLAERGIACRLPALHGFDL